jgi:DNA-binding transcriptional LysR family regulator
MDIDQLLAFDRVVREGSFSRAAWSLDITQPTISARIQALEQQVGGALFVRGGRRVALTERGESFLRYARRALAVLDEGIEAARLTQVGQRGRVTVGTLTSLAGGFLASAIARFHTAHPQVELYMRTGNSDQVVEMLRDGVVKVGLITAPAHNPDLTPLLYFREPLVLVAPAGHPLARRGLVDLAEVERESRPFLLVRWGPAMNPVLARLDLQAEPTVELPIETVLHLLRRGIGAAFLTRTFVMDDLAAGRLVEVAVHDLPPLFRESTLVRPARRGAFATATADFVSALREEAGVLGLMVRPENREPRTENRKT